MWLAILFCAVNPFHIDFGPKEAISNEDYVRIQKQLELIFRTRFLDPFLSPEDSFWMHHYEWGRPTQGVKSTLIKPQAGLYPIQELLKIGKGGDRCVVSYASYDRNYHLLIRAIPEALKQVGFNGYLYFRIGGYPNPTGREIQYAGVPYAFKVFMMSEAKNLGFNKLLWIDSAALPLRDPSPLFEQIEKTGALFHGWKSDRNGTPHLDSIFLTARRFLEETTGVDIYDEPYIPTGIFGFDLSSPMIQELVEEHYQFVESGIGFLSEWPESYVLTAILGQPKNRALAPKLFSTLVAGPDPDESELTVRELKKSGYFFYIRNH